MKSYIDVTLSQNSRYTPLQHTKNLPPCDLFTIKLTTTSGHGDKKLDRIPVPMETQLRVRHGAVGHVAPGDGGDPHPGPREALRARHDRGAAAVRLRERNGDDDAVSCADPEPVGRYQESGDADEGETELACAEHLAHVRFDVDVLQVLVGVGVVEAEGGVEPDRDPDAFA